MSAEVIAAVVGGLVAFLTLVGSAVAILRRLDSNTVALQQTFTREIHGLDLKINSVETIVQPYAADISDLRRVQASNIERVTQMEATMANTQSNLERVQRQVDNLQSR